MTLSFRWIPTFNTFALALPLGILLPSYGAALEPSALRSASPVHTSLQTSDSTGAQAIDIAADIPTAQQWQDHVQQDLLPFWSVPDALGEPVGNFPSVRCNDGSLINLDNPCSEVQTDDWLMTGDQYVVALSRQVYTYGVAFQLTGELQYLEYAKAGVDYLRHNAIDRTEGGAYSWWNAKEQAWGPALDYRNPQEQAYALMGMAYYYYLTRDSEVLQDILALKNFIFETYYNSELDLLQWQLQDSEFHRALDQNLVAQLDQLNTYMLLLTPTLPEPEKTKWTQDMVWLSNSMLDTFYSADKNLFSLSVPSPNSQDNLETATDFGHTIKTMWLVRMIGILSNEPSLVDFVAENAPKILEQAFMPEFGAWADGIYPDGALNQNASWWTYAELNQFTASFALVDPSMTAYLSQTYGHWFDHFVDPQFGEIWNTIDVSTHEPVQTLPKQWPWKNGYHSLEHALVGYITSSQLHQDPVVLHYAFEQLPELDTIHPYYYQGKIDQITLVPSENRLTIYRVTFSEVH